MGNDLTTTTPELHKCQHCSYTPATKRGIAIHTGRSHPELIVKKVVDAKLKCPLCDHTCATGRALSMHSTKTHGTSSTQLYDMLNQGDNGKCKECSSPTTFIGIDDGYFELCGTCSRKQAFAKKREENCGSWNKGLTKDSDARLTAVSESLRKHYAENVHHSTGHTKENDPVLAEAAKKISAGIKEFYKTHKHWSKGLTKENSEALKLRGEKISLAKKGVKLTEEHKLALRNAKLLSQGKVEERLSEHRLRLVSTYVDSMTPVDLQCTKCSSIFKRKTGSVFYNAAKCPTCHPPFSSKSSKWQDEVAAYVSSVGFNALLNDRTAIAPKKLDVFGPDRKLAIECNGLYWHSDSAGVFSPTHAEEKRIACSSSGITLLTLFQDEWEQKRRIVENVIAHKLGVHEKRVHARSCRAEATQFSSLRGFFDKNRLDGYAAATKAVVLIDGSSEVVGAATLRYLRNDKSRKTAELARICFKVGHHVPSGVSKLLRTAANEAREMDVALLMTYVDGRVGDASGYEAAGMMILERTVPRFWWTDGLCRHDRFKFRAIRKLG